MFEQIQEAVDFIRGRSNIKPSIAIILGTGMGQFVKALEGAEAIPYDVIPHFPKSTVESHEGKLYFGQISGRQVAVLAGRFHYYEGYSMKEVTFPIRVLKFLGISTLLISNASGSINATINTGDLVLVKDHIDLFPENPLRGINDPRLGDRFPDMANAYSPTLRNLVQKIAVNRSIVLKEGIYAGLSGPSLETPAEYNYLNKIGADIVGMSTIPEVLVARQMQIDVLVISVATNKCFPISEITETTLEDVIEVANKASKKLEIIFRSLIEEQ